MRLHVIIGLTALFFAHHLFESPVTPTARAQSDATPANGQSSAAEFLNDPVQQAFLPLIKKPSQIYLPISQIPYAFEQPFPADAARRQSLNAYLTWSFREDLYGDDYQFEVYLESDDNTPGQLIGVTTNNFLEPPFTFELDTNYYWQVVAIHVPDGRRHLGAIWSFHTEDMPYPPPVGEMIAIAATEFMMGCDSSNPVEDPCTSGLVHVEIPLHLVRLDAYEIDKYEVTNGEYKACVRADACNGPRRSGSRYREHYYDYSAYDYHPVLYVSHWDAEDYCGWVDKRLPTEAEWELAARGSVDTRKWPWGDEPQDCTRAAKNEDNERCLHPQDMVSVGSYPRGASPYGLMDVAGNAFEWVADKYDVLYYSYSPTDNPPGPDFSRATKTLPARNEYGYPLFTLRGGANTDDAHYMRTAHRHWGHHGDAPLFRSFRVGFRCARSVEE